MKRTSKFGRITVKLFQHSTTMQTSIGVGFELARLGAHDQEGHPGNIVPVVVPRLRNILFSTRKLPNFFPKPLDFELMPGRAGVTLDRISLQAHSFGRLQAQHIGHRS